MRYASEIERILAKSYGVRRVARYVVVLALIWLLVLSTYVLPMKSIEYMFPYAFWGWKEDPFNYFMTFYGVGMILATMITALESIEFTVEEISSLLYDRWLVQAVLKVKSIRQGRAAYVDRSSGHSTLLGFQFARQ